MRTELYTVRKIIDLIESGQLLEDFTCISWNEHKQQTFIDSFLINMSTPTIYLFEKYHNIFSVLDGYYYVVSIYRYINSKIVPSLESTGLFFRKKFCELDAISQNRIEDHQITVNILEDAIDWEPFTRSMRVSQ